MSSLEWDWNPEKFKRWKCGLTGYPMVDATMRQLATIGWCHDSMRMLVSSFFVHMLCLPWYLPHRLGVS